MTIWFVIPANREAAFRAIYLAERVHGTDNAQKRDDQGNAVDSPDEAEKIGVMVPNADGTKLMTGSSRALAAVGRRLRDNNPPWLEVYATWPQPGWEGA